MTPAMLSEAIVGMQDTIMERMQQLVNSHVQVERQGDQAGGEGAQGGVEEQSGDRDERQRVPSNTPAGVSNGSSSNGSPPANSSAAESVESRILALLTQLTEQRNSSRGAPTVSSTLDQYDDSHREIAKYLEFVPRLVNFGKAGTLDRRSVERMVRNTIEASDLPSNAYITSYDGFPVTLGRARKLLEEGILSLVESNPTTSLPDVSSKDRFLDFQDRIASGIWGHNNLALFHLHHAQFAMKCLISEIASLHPAEALFWHQLLDAAFYNTMSDTFRELAHNKAHGMTQFLGKKFRVPPVPTSGGQASTSRFSDSNRNGFFRGQGSNGSNPSSNQGFKQGSHPSGNQGFKPSQPGGGGGGGAQPASRQ